MNSFDGYTSSISTVEVNINQSLTTTPLDPSVLEDPYCELETVEDTNSTSNHTSQQTSIEWLFPILGLFVGLPIIYRKSDRKRGK